MPSFGSLFGSGSIGEQLFVWGLLSNIVQALTEPGINELGYLVNEAVPNTVLDPATLAALVARTLDDQGDAASDAAKSGISGDRFDKLVKASQHSPDLSLVVAAFQRGLLAAGSADGTQESLFGALTDQGVRPEWLPIIEKLAVQIPTIAEVMNAWLEGQIDEGEARTRYLAAGGDPTWFQTSYNANGQAPTPSQALELLNRGIIPESGTGPDAVSYEQAFLEGPWRNKWLPSFLALRYYYPPPRTVTAMFHAGQLTHDQAAGYLAKQGLDSTLVTAYLSPSHASTSATEKALAKGDILSLYTDRLLTRAQALQHLEALKYTAADADLILELTDVKATTSALTASVNRIKTLYLAGKITEQDAHASLVTLQVPADQATEIVDTWSVGEQAPVRTLSAAQIETGWYLDLISTDDALAQLLALGYDDLDAWLLLSIKGKAPLKGVPRPSK